MKNYHFLKLVANNGVGKIISFFLKKLTDIVIIFSLHNNQSRFQWFLSNQCWATSYDYSVYHQIEISTMSWKGLITYYFESWMVHLTSISCKSLCLRWPYKEEPCPRNGGAIWVDDVIEIGLTACVRDSSNSTKEVNWIAVGTAPLGSQISTKLRSSWTTGTECERIDFQQVELC